MANVLSFPFRLGANGAVTEVQQFSKRGSEEALAHLILTHRGERPYVPAFGITDPAFRRVDPNEIRVGWLLFGDTRPIVRITSNLTSTTERVVVELGG